MIEVLLLIHAFATLSMVGVIWFVQLVHYPLMPHVDGSRFPKFEIEHQRRTSWVVAPLMLIEAGTSMLILLISRDTSIWLAWLGVVSLVAIWVSTFSWQVPCHARLEKSFDEQTHRDLVHSNWFRTVLWTLRGSVACGLLL